jgi:hypothetical protein
MVALHSPRIKEGGQIGHGQFVEGCLMYGYPKRLRVAQKNAPPGKNSVPHRLVDPGNGSERSWDWRLSMAGQPAGDSLSTPKSVTKSG